MCMTRLWIRASLTLGVVAMLFGYAQAQVQHPDYMPTATYPPSWEWGVAQQETASPHRIGADLHRAARLIGSPITNTEGKKLGKVHDLVLTTGLEGISYAVVSTGGLFGLGTQLHAIPWSAVQTSIDGNLTVPISEREFEQDRGFTGDNWPSEGNPRWLSRSGERTEQVTYGMTTTAEQRDIRQRRFSKVKGMKVMGPQDRDVGDIHDLVVATDTGRIAFAIVSFGGLFGLGEEYAAVPMGAVTFRPELRIARVDVDRQALEAYAFSGGAFPDLSNPRYVQQLNRAYGVGSSYDTVLGYVPPEEPASAGRMTPPATGMKAPTEADLTGTFDPARVSTIEGTVTDLGKYKCSKTGMDVLWLRIRTDDGQIVAVNAGPRKYVAGQDFYVVKGDRIGLTGSYVPAATAGKRIFLPMEITFGENTLRLTDSNGRPLWESLMEEHGERHPGVTPSLSPGQHPGAFSSRVSPWS